MLLRVTRQPVNSTWSVPSVTGRTAAPLRAQAVEVLRQAITSLNLAEGERLVEREEPVAAIVSAGFERETVLKVERLLNIAEYKRRQAAPGVKVTLKNFGRDRRYPIVNRFRDTGAPLAEPDRALLKAGASARNEAFDF